MRAWTSRGGRTPSLAVGALAGLAPATVLLPPIGSAAVRCADDALARSVFVTVASAVRRPAGSPRDTGINAVVEPDLPRVLATLSNSISNSRTAWRKALRHTGHGLTVSVVAEREYSRVQITVIDRRGGLDPERIFESFVIGSGRTTTTGIDLALSRAIVAEHGETIGLLPAHAERTAAIVECQEP